MNIVILMGNVGQDPVFYDSGLTKFSLATTTRWTDKEGAKQEKTEWHDVATYGKTATFAKEFLKKGSRIVIRGKIGYNKKDDKTFTNIVADEIQFAGPKPKAEGETEGKKEAEFDIF